VGLCLPKSIHDQFAVGQQVLDDLRVGSDGRQVDAVKLDGLIVAVDVKTTCSSISSSRS
jgi:hypothetical protein